MSTREAWDLVDALTKIADAEKVIGLGYNINILKKATHLGLVAPKNHIEYLNDQRSGLDLAVRLCASGIIASLATAFLMWPWDVWLSLAAVPYTLAYVSYRGALVAATHYGDALVVGIGSSPGVAATTKRPATPRAGCAAMVRVVNSAPPTFARAQMSITSSSRRPPSPATCTGTGRFLHYRQSVSAVACQLAVPERHEPIAGLPAPTT